MRRKEERPGGLRAGADAFEAVFPVAPRRRDKASERGLICAGAFAAGPRACRLTAHFVRGKFCPVS